MKRWNNEVFYFISKELYIALLLETHRSLHYTTKHPEMYFIYPTTLSHYSGKLPRNKYENTLLKSYIT